MADNKNRFRQRVFPEIDYTRHDEVVTQLLEVIVCPTNKEIPDNNIIFHHQCYNRQARNRYVKVEQRENRSGERRGTRRPGDNNRLKCTYTEENFSINEALKKHVHEVLDRRRIRILIEKRVASLRPRE